MKAPKSTKATNIEQYHIPLFLNKHCVATKETGQNGRPICHYINGPSTDGGMAELVMEAIGYDKEVMAARLSIVTHRVKKTRQAAFGDLRRHNGKRRYATGRQLSALGEQMRSLEQQLEDVRMRLDAAGL